MTPETCGGCRGLGAHSPRCHTQPGHRFRRWADEADSLGDRIGPNDMQASEALWQIATRLRKRAKQCQ